MHLWSIDLDIAVNRAVNVNVLTRWDANHHWIFADATWASIWVFVFFTALRAPIVGVASFFLPPIDHCPDVAKEQVTYFFVGVLTWFIHGFRIALAPLAQAQKVRPVFRPLCCIYLRGMCLHTTAHGPSA